MIEKLQDIVLKKLKATNIHKEFSLGNWGKVDFVFEHNDCSVFVEIEEGQKHPHNNVVKLWPYLEENPKKKITLIHIIAQKNKAPKNRIRLCKFYGNKIETEFTNRFRYHFLKEEEINNHSVKDLILLFND